MKIIAPFLLALLIALTTSLRGASEHVEPGRNGPAPRLFEKITSLQMKELLSRQGFKGAEIDGDDDLIVQMEGHPVLIIVRGSSYTNIQFRYTVQATSTLEWVNAWNRDKKYTKAYVSDSGNTVLEMDLDLAGGVTEARIKDGIKAFAQFVTVFLKELE